MTEGQGSPPQYKGHIEIAAWVKQDKNGKKFLSLKIGNYANLFKNEPRPQGQGQPQPTQQVGL